MTNINDSPNPEIDWNTCIEFQGPEAALPTGLAHLTKGISVLDMLAELSTLT